MRRGSLRGRRFDLRPFPIPERYISAPRPRHRRKSRHVSLPVLSPATPGAFARSEFGTSPFGGPS